MSVRLDENFYLDSDSYQWILKMDKPSTYMNKGVETECRKKDEWYCSTLKHALTRYLNESMKESGSISDILKRIDEVEDIIKNISLDDNGNNVEDEGEESDDEWVDSIQENTDYCTETKNV